MAYKVCRGFDDSKMFYMTQTDQNVKLPPVFGCDSSDYFGLKLLISYCFSSLSDVEGLCGVPVLFEARTLVSNQTVNSFKALLTSSSLLNTGIVQLGSLTFCGYKDVDSIKKTNLLVSLNSVE